MNNQNQRQFVEVGTNASNNRRWEPQKTELMQGQPFPFIEGYFKSLTERSGPNGPFNVACIVTLNLDGTLGEEIDVSGGMALDNKLRELPLNSYLRIIYEGKAKSKTPGRTYNVFKTLQDPNAIPFSQLGGVSAPVQQQVPSVQNQQFQQPISNNGQQFANPFGQGNNNGQQFIPPAQTQMAPPTQNQQWVPPTQSNGQNFAQQNPVNPNTFGGNGQNDDLPF